ncbi:MAG: virulence factor SrfC family protein [bacterium]|nr:virulence factor SrfC family protein [bacterium]
MSESAEGLAKRCLAVADLASRAGAWIGDDANRDKVGAQGPAFDRDFRRARFRAGKLATAAGRNMCVGVYGPSQAGKSYLISVLGRPKGGDLVAAFDGVGRPVTYLDEINPEGQGESTGLVTRFTTQKVPAPAGYPVRVNLLSQADIARVLINAFAEDGDNTEAPPSAEELEHLLKTAQGKASAAGKAMTVEEMWDVQDYIASHFGHLAYFASLADYWSRAADLVPRVNLATRTELLAVLWGRHAPLTDLYLALATHLEALGGAHDAFVPLEALIPRETSIIDVQTLKDLDRESRGGHDAVEVTTGDGAVVRIRRGHLCAMVAEMIVPMADVPWEFMQRTDLLDFPGTRNRFTHDLDRFLVQGESPVSQLFLRGKVAYLFDRYVAEQEMTSMILCVGDGNMEAKDLPGLVENWVAATHGNTPARRAEARCILFFVLTKFDTLLVESGGSGDDPVTRFERRIQNSMAEPFGKMAGAWINEWTPHTPFTNTYWMRNPTYETPLMAYDANRREAAIREDMTSRLETLRQGAVTAPLAQRHFTDPQAAWDAALTIDDGGVTRLAEALADVCHIETKLDQVRDQLDILIDGIQRPIARFHVSSDLEERLALRREAADSVLDSLDMCFDDNRFAELLEDLMINPAVVADRMARVPADIFIVAEGQQPPPDDSATTGRQSARPRPGGRRQERPGEAKPPVETGEGPRTRRMTMEGFQAERALTTWIDGLHDLVARPEWRRRFSLTEKTASDLVTELIEAARRLSLHDDIVTVLGKWNFSLHSDRRAAPAAAIAADTVNSFVARLGMDRLPQDRRPHVELEGSGSRPVFQEQPTRDDATTFSFASDTGAEEQFVDWTHALFRIFEDNARSMGGETVDMEQNLVLGEIIGALEANRTGS